MRLPQPFLKLPLRFDAETLERELRALPRSAWVPHATGFAGNEAVRLITVGGGPNDRFRGEMGPTEHLLACPYVMEIMDELDGVWGRSRFMGLGAGAEVPLHVDSHYYWRTHWRIHIPVVTNPRVTFSCGPETVHMAAGECWLFDSFRWHRVLNGGDEQRVHLVLDTVGSERLWELMDKARSGAEHSHLLSPGERSPTSLRYEKINLPKVMSPWEIRQHVAFLAANVAPHPLVEPVFRRLDRFMDDWAVVWAQYGTDDEGVPTYERVIEGVKEDLSAMGGGRMLLNNQFHLFLALEHLVFVNALHWPTPEELSAVPAAA